MSAQILAFPLGRPVSPTAGIAAERLAELARRMDARMEELSRRPVTSSIDDGRLQALAAILAAAMDRAELRTAGDA